MADRADVGSVGASRRSRSLRVAWPWLAGSLLAGAMLASSVVVAQPEDPLEIVRSFEPLELGTTWVYETTIDGKASGRHYRQVSGKVNLALSGGEGFAVRNLYEDYLGRGQTFASTIYLAGRGDAIAQLGLRSGGDFSAFTPALKLYDPPFDRQSEYHYEGDLAGTKLVYDITNEGIEDVSAGGRDYEGCAHIRSDLVLGEGDQEQRESVDEWKCPGVGTVKIVDVLETLGIVLEEELIAFVGAENGFGDVEPADIEDFDVTAPASGEVDATELSRTPAWTITGNQNLIFAPATSNGAMFTAEQDGRLAATDMTTGETKWSIKLEAPLVTPPVVSGDVVLVADPSRNLYAIDAAGGWARWSVAFDDVAASKPVVSDGVAYLTTDANTIEAIDVSNGDIVWSKDLSAISRRAPLVAGDMVVVLDDAGGLTAFDSQDGDTVWTAEMEHVAVGELGGSSEVVVAADNSGSTYAYDVGDGELLWSEVFLDRMEGIAADSDHFVMLTESDEVVVMDARGEILWRSPVGTTDVPPALVGKHVVTVSERGQVVIFDAASGAPAGSFELVRPPGVEEIAVDLPLVVTDGGFLVSAAQENDAGRNMIYMLTDDPDAGGVVVGSESYAIPTSPMVAPAIASDGTMYVAGSDRSLYVVPPGGASEALANIPSEFTSEETLISFVASASTPGGEVFASQGDSTVHGFSNGEEIWTTDVRTTAYPGAVGVGGDGVFYVPEQGQGLAALDASTGRVLWRHGSTGVGSGRPAVLEDGVVYASGGLYRLDRQGKEVWGLPGLETFAPIEVDNGIVYFVGGDPSGELNLIAFDLADGTPVWAKPAFDLDIFVGPTTGDGVTVTIESDGVVKTYDALTGAEKWSVTLPDGPAAAPVIEDGRVLVINEARDEDLFQRTYRVYVYDLATGAFLGAYEPAGPGYETVPAVTQTNDGIYIPSTGIQASAFERLEVTGP
jgi:outer membrane protein assembly factor BamB